MNLHFKLEHFLTLEKQKKKLVSLSVPFLFQSRCTSTAASFRQSDGCLIFFSRMAMVMGMSDESLNFLLYKVIFS